MIATDNLSHSIYIQRLATHQSREPERSAEVDLVLGDYSKARRQLGWQPRVNLEQLAKMMVAADLAEAQSQIR